MPIILRCLTMILSAKDASSGRVEMASFCSLLSFWPVIMCEGGSNFDLSEKLLPSKKYFLRNALNLAELFVSMDVSTSKVDSLSSISMVARNNVED